MTFFDNVFDIQDVSDYCVSGLSNELVFINLHDSYYQITITKTLNNYL